MIEESARLMPITSGIFSTISAAIGETEAGGRDVINLGIGSPDLPPAPHVVERLREELYVRENYDYGSSQGLPELRGAVAAWYARRFGVDLDPALETLVLMGSHDGLAHVPLAFLNPGDVALIPSPHYPVYKVGAQLAQAEIVDMPLTAANDWLPDLDAIRADVKARAKLMLLNYPNNPVAAIADLAFMERAVAFARENNILLVHDAAYSELALADDVPPSILQVPGAKEVAIEFHSVSKTYNIAGCRLGFVVGNALAIGVLAKLKSNLDYGVFKAIQQAGVAALLGPQEIVASNRRTYKKRMNVFREGAARAGWHIPQSPATMFLWAPIPDNILAVDFALTLIRKAGVAVIPGTAFGKHGEGYVRIAMVTSEDRLREAARRLSDAGLRFS